MTDDSGISNSIRQQFQFADATVGQLPATAAPNNEVATGIGPGFSFIDGKQLEPGRAWDFRGGTRHQGELHAVVIQGDFVTGHAFFFSLGTWNNQRRVAFQIRKVGRADEHAAKFGLAADKIRQAEFGHRVVFGEQNFTRVEAVEVLAVPFAVVVALVGKSFFMPAGKIVVDEQVQFKMHMGAVLGDRFAGVRRAAHGGDDFAGLDLFADGEAGLDFAQMRVERINFNAFDDVTDDDIFAVIR